MKVKLLGGGAFYGPDGTMVSFGPNSTIEVDNGDKVAVAFWQERVDSGAAELVDAPPKAAAATAVKAAKLSVTAPAVAPAPATEAPPKAGPGSSRDAWATYAETLGVTVTEDMSRDDIADAVEDEG
jgi:hypothetical protein